MLAADFRLPLDVELFRLLNRDGGPVLDGLMRAASSRIFGVAAGIVLALLVVARLRGSAARFLLALPIALATSDLVGARVLKPLLGRTRPCYALAPGTFRWLAPAANAGSLPSLHAANTFAFALLVALARPRLAPLAYLVAVLVSVSRVYVGVHWPSDVVAGAVWGTLAAALGWAIAALASGRRRSPGWDARAESHGGDPAGSGRTDR